MTLRAFEQLILEELLPAYCNDPQRLWGTEGFRPDWAVISDRDAEDFLRGLGGGLISHVGRGLYRAPRSCASEQFFWPGRKDIVPRPITLWVEPVITVAVLARLHFVHGWPKGLLGTQSADWAFDVIAHLENESDDEHIACEVKKTKAELDQLISLMQRYATEGTEEPPRSGKELNAFRKVQSLRARRAPLFWAVGPNGANSVFRVRYGDNEDLTFLSADISALVYPR